MLQRLVENCAATHVDAGAVVRTRLSFVPCSRNRCSGGSSWIRSAVSLSRGAPFVLRTFPPRAVENLGFCNVLSMQARDVNACLQTCNNSCVGFILFRHRLRTMYGSMPSSSIETPRPGRSGNRNSPSLSCHPVSDASCRRFERPPWNSWRSSGDDTAAHWRVAA